MPIQGPSSYVPTCQAFLTHWAEVNAALTAPDELTLSGTLLVQATPVTRTDVALLYAALLAQRTAVTEALVEVDFARSDLAVLKVRMVQRISEMIAFVRGNLPGSKFERALPAQPDADSALHILQEAAGRVNKVWVTINTGVVVGLAVPVVLNGAYDQVAFGGDLTALPGGYLAVTNFAGALKLAQEERNDLQDQIYPLLKAYRQVMPTKFAPGNALTDALPLLTPLPGSTPEAVVLTGVLDAPTQQARLTWAASAEVDLDHYEVRAVPGDVYHLDDEVQVATIALDAPRELLTDQFLSAAGQTASFKVYVVLTTENEAGSNAVAVTRTA